MFPFLAYFSATCSKVVNANVCLYFGSTIGPDGELALVMEYLPKGDLETLLKKSK